MAQYYFIGTMLPVLSFDSPPEVGFSKLDRLFRDNLSPKDYAKTKVLRGFFDLLNLRSLWMGENIDPRGEMNATQLEEAVINNTGLPDYVFEYLARYTDKADRIAHFPFLLARFFQEGVHVQDRFLRDYLNFERELRLVMTAFRAKALGRDLSIEFKYENPEEEIISELLDQKEAKEFEPPEKYHALKGIYERDKGDSLALAKALDEYRFNYVDSLVDMADVFSIERLLAYMVQLNIVQTWFDFDEERGMEIVDTIAKEK